MKTHAFPLQLAREAVFLSRYNEAVQLLKLLSAAGDRDAQFLHSYLHFWDDDLPRTAAVDMMRGAAESGHVEANYLLAVSPDLSPSDRFSLPTTDERMARLRFAAEHGSVYAQTDLARCYLDGIGVVQDAQRARELLQAAYHQQENARPYHFLPKTCLLLGRMLLEGIGGEPSTQEGKRALKRCQYQYGDPLAEEAIALYLDLEEQNPDPARTEYQIKELEDTRSELEHIRAKASTEWQRTIERYCLTTLHYDLRSASFDEFVGFVFEHFPPSNKNARDPNWMWVATVEFDARTLLRYYTQLFNEPAFLLERYTDEEIEFGLGMEGIRGWGNWTLGCVLTHADNTLDEAEACIRSLYPLFTKLFVREPLRELANMWWDIGYGACGSYPYPPKRVDAEEDRGRLYQASFETMVQVLQTRSTICQAAAIHGLGHSKHPDKEKVLRQYLDDHPDISDGNRAYVMSAITGNIL